MGYPHSPPAEGGPGQASCLGFWAPRVCKDIDKWHLGQAGGHLVWGERRPMAAAKGPVLLKQERILAGGLEGSSHTCSQLLGYL